MKRSEEALQWLCWSVDTVVVVTPSIMHIQFSGPTGLQIPQCFQLTHFRRSEHDITDWPKCCRHILPRLHEIQQMVMQYLRNFHLFTVEQHSVLGISPSGIIL